MTGFVLPKVSPLVRNSAKHALRLELVLAVSTSPLRRRLALHAAYLRHDDAFELRPPPRGGGAAGVDGHVARLAARLFDAEHVVIPRPVGGPAGAKEKSNHDRDEDQEAGR